MSVARPTGRVRRTRPAAERARNVIQDKDGAETVTLEGSVTSNITNYINASGYIYLLVHNLVVGNYCTDVRYAEAGISTG